MTAPGLDPESGNALPGTLRAIRGALRRDVGLRAISANTLWLVTDRLLGLAISVVVSVLVVRYLGPSDFGRLSLAMAVVAIGASLAQLGLDSVVVRELVRDPSARDEILGTAFGLMLGAAAIMIPLVVGAGELVGAGDARMRAMLGILAMQYLFQSVNVIDYWFRSGIRSKYTVWSSKVGLLANGLLSLALIRAGAGVVSFACTVVLESAVLAAGLVVWYRYTRESVTSWRFSAGRARTLVVAALPLLIAGLAGSIYARINSIMLGRLVGESAVGIYAAASRITELWYFVPTAVMFSLYPALIRSRATEEVQYVRRRQALYDLMASIAYLIVIPTTLLGGPMITAIFGPAYAQAGAVLSVHIWTLLLIAVGIARSNWLVVEEMEWPYMWSAAGGAVTNIVLAWILIPLFGVVAAAWASLLALLFIVFGSAAFSKRLHPAAKEVSLALLVPFRWRALRTAVVHGLEGRL